LNKLPVLFIPGTLCTPAVFDHQIKAFKSLASNIDTVQFGLEDSIPKMAETAIKHIQRRKGAAIIGFSMGGMVALEIARRAPELMKKLCLLNSNFGADITGRHLARLQHLEEANSKSMGVMIRRYYLDRYLYKASSDIEELIIEMASKLGTKCFAAQINALAMRQDSSKSLQDIQCPTLILGSTQDQFCPPGLQTQMHQLIKNSTLRILNDCGHFSMLEKPLEVNQALQEWYLAL
jgi:pimeloyl-ACP methyl ester carboxylesterase